MSGFPPTYPPQTPPQKKSRTWIVIVAVVVIVAVIAVAAFASIPSPKPSPNVFYPAGTTLTIANKSYKGETFTLNAQATLSGSFVSSAPVTIYVLNPQDFANFSSTDHANAYLWTSGANVTTASISSNFAAGPYYFIIVNYGTAACTFTFSTAFEATPY